jgi:hypothetical protein
MRAEAGGKRGVAVGAQVKRLAGDRIDHGAAAVVDDGGAGVETHIEVIREVANELREQLHVEANSRKGATETRAEERFRGMERARGGGADLERVDIGLERKELVEVVNKVAADTEIAALDGAGKCEAGKLAASLKPRNAVIKNSLGRKGQRHREKEATHQQRDAKASWSPPRIGRGEKMQGQDRRGLRATKELEGMPAVDVARSQDSCPQKLANAAAIPSSH